MSRWSSSDLALATGGLLRRPFAAGGVSIDSRTVRPGELFVALETETGDGHRFVAAALAAGAGGAMVHRLPDGVADDAPLLQVPDTLRGLWALGGFARARFSGRLVAITGSVGKTTTKEMLRRALAPFGTVWAAEASYNNQWGVPLTLARCPPAHAYCICEIGTNHPGEIAPLARLARPHVAAVTAVTEAHIGHFADRAALRAEKFSIVEGLEPGGVAVLPEADAAGLAAFTHGEAGDARLVSYEGTAEGGRLVAAFLRREGPSPSHASHGPLPLPRSAGEGLVAEPPLPFFTGEGWGEGVTLTLNAPGRHMADNAVVALAIVAALGLDVAKAAAALDGFSAVSGRGARRRIPWQNGELLLIDESYNASPAAVRAALEVLALQPGRRVAVLGDMLELGPDAPAYHAALAPNVLAAEATLFACGTLSRALADAVPNAIHAADSAELAPIVTASLRAGDAVLVKGSLGSRMKRVVDAIEAAP